MSSRRRRTCGCDRRRPVVRRCPGKGVVVGTRLAEVLLEERQRLGLEVGAVADPSRSILRTSRPDPVEPPDRQVLDKGRAHPRRDDEQAVGLALVGGHLGEELVVGDARGRGQPGLVIL